MLEPVGDGRVGAEQHDDVALERSRVRPDVEAQCGYGTYPRRDWQETRAGSAARAGGGGLASFRRHRDVVDDTAEIYDRA